MYLLDTNVISESRKQHKANRGVQDFLHTAKRNAVPLYLSVISVGELRRGVENIRHRGDMAQALLLENWLTHIEQTPSFVLPFDARCADIWGRLRVPHHENAIDKQIAATALAYGFTLVTRNVKDFRQTGVELLNPFQS